MMTNAIQDNNFVMLRYKCQSFGLPHFVSFRSIPITGTVQFGSACNLVYMIPTRLLKTQKVVTSPDYPVKCKSCNAELLPVKTCIGNSTSET